jgi:mannose-6-phosphate isomerase-like protein (cupin superfamily)
MKLIWGIVAMAITTSTALAQAGGVNHYSTDQLKQMAQKLEQQESFRTTGSAAETLDKYPGSFTMLSVRNANGGAELHEHYADIFFVVDGEATLTSGGTIVDPKTTAPVRYEGARSPAVRSRSLARAMWFTLRPTRRTSFPFQKGRRSPTLSSR